MKIDFKRLNELLEAKAGRAIDRLDGLKCYTDEFQDTLDSIVYMLEVSKELEQYDTECPDCKHRAEINNEQPEYQQQNQKTMVGKKYKAFDPVLTGLNRLVLFYSDNCGPCRYLKPILEEYVMEKDIPLELVLVDEQSGVAHADLHKVQGWPTIFVIQDEIVVSTSVGADINATAEVTKTRLETDLGRFF